LPCFIDKTDWRVESCHEFDGAERAKAVLLTVGMRILMQDATYCWAGQRTRAELGQAANHGVD